VFVGELADSIFIDVPKVIAKINWPIGIPTS
jgi:hypothetical protein